MSSPRRQARPDERADADETDADDPSDETPGVNARDVDGERIVFTEDGNSDGWISTDYTVVPSE